MAELARLQHGVVSRRQLLDLGFGRGGIDARLARGSLHPVHRGVYAVGHSRLTWRGRLWAAALAKDAAHSHRCGAAIWDLLAPGPIEMTTLAGARSSPGITVHRSRTLTDRHITTVDGLPVTTVARTVVDLLDVLPPDRIPALLRRADFLGILDFADVATSLPGRRSKGLKHAIEEIAGNGPQPTRSELEERFLTIVRRAGLPMPLVNHPLEGFIADFLWPEHALVVETDGAAGHLTQAAFEDDRRRDAALLLAGYRVVRFTYRQVSDHPEEVAVTLARLLALDCARPWWGSRAVKGDGL
jgi:very-short-patch-repair endonuclease